MYVSSMDPELIKQFLTEVEQSYERAYQTYFNALKERTIDQIANLMLSSESGGPVGSFDPTVGSKNDPEIAKWEIKQKLKDQPAIEGGFAR